MPQPYLAKPAAAIAILQKYGLHTQKKYGQNFLIDAHVPEKITEAAEVGKEDCCIEIGPGIGTLTQYLAEKAGRVVAIEVDTGLLPVLSETLADYENAAVISADVLKVDMKELIRKYAEGRRIKVVANLPYYITTPILMTMLEAELPVVFYTLMVQKEVADRMQAGPGTKDYGALSLAVQYYTEPEVVMQVSPACFLPQPKVGSTVVRLTGRQDGLAEEERKKLFCVIRASFGQRRKTLYNSLRNAPEIDLPKERIMEALESCGLRPDVRGEALSLSQFIEFTEKLFS